MACVSRGRIRERLQGAAAPVPPRPWMAVDVRSHVTVAAGPKMVIKPGQAGLSPEQLRHVVKRRRQSQTDPRDVGKKRGHSGAG
jgi:hypothetical protein